MKTIKILFLLPALLVALAILCGSCKDSERAQFAALGMRHRVTMYAANGSIIKQWVSTGNVSNQEQGDGWYFEDEATRRLVEIAGGAIIIEVIAPSN